MASDHSGPGASNRRQTSTFRQKSDLTLIPNNAAFECRAELCRRSTQPGPRQLLRQRANPRLISALCPSLTVAPAPAPKVSRAVLATAWPQPTPERFASAPLCKPGTVPHPFLTTRAIKACADSSACRLSAGICNASRAARAFCPCKQMPTLHSAVSA